MKRLPVRGVMFDLDGTLLDTLADLHAAANAMLAQAQLPALPREKVRSYVGRGIPNLVRRCLIGARGGVEPHPLEWDAMVTVFRQHYGRINGEHTVAYPGVMPTLEALSRAGVWLACVTNKSAEFSNPLLARMGLLPWFQVVISGDTLPKKKPHPMPLLHACQHFALPAAEMLMVGDSGNDIAAARAAGCPVFCVDYGYNEGVPLCAEECDALVGALPDILPLIDCLPRAQRA